MRTKSKAPHPKLKTFLREWRKFRGMNQTEAGAAIGMDQGNLAKIERGKVAYTQETLEKLANVYKCKPGDLISFDPKTDCVSVALSRLRNQPESIQEKALIFIDGLINGAEVAFPSAGEEGSPDSRRTPLSGEEHDALQLAQGVGGPTPNRYRR